MPNDTKKDTPLHDFKLTSRTNQNYSFKVTASSFPSTSISHDFSPFKLGELTPPSSPGSEFFDNIDDSFFHQSSPGACSATKSSFISSFNIHGNLKRFSISSEIERAGLPSPILEEQSEDLKFENKRVAKETSSNSYSSLTATTEEKKLKDVESLSKYQFNCPIIPAQALSFSANCTHANIPALLPAHLRTLTIPNRSTFIPDPLTQLQQNMASQVALDEEDRRQFDFELNKSGKNFLKVARSCDGNLKPSDAIKFYYRYGYVLR